VQTLVDFDATRCVVVHLHFHTEGCRHIKSIWIQCHIVSRCKYWNGPVCIVLVSAAKFVIHLVTESQKIWMAHRISGNLSSPVTHQLSHNLAILKYIINTQRTHCRRRARHENAFARWNTRIVGSNQARGMDVFPPFSVFVLSYLGNGLATGCYLVQRILPTVYKIHIFRLILKWEQTRGTNPLWRKRR
jgi:hypothetical protein